MASNAVVLENKLPGTPQSVWDLSGPGSTNIEGFATDISINHGDTANFKINTDSTNYRIDIYRLGYYGGNGARLVTTIQHQSGTAIWQPAPLTDPTTGLVDAGNWQVTDSWNIPANAVSGVYIAKLVREDGTFGENHIPFIVRNDGGHSDIVFQTSDTTWQAYNSWGGHSLYDGTSVAVSYNRPFITRDIGQGQNFVFGEEYPAIRWLEANGYDVSYIAGVDTARSGSQLLNHRIFLPVGHDEYWSGDQRANVEAARDAGVNLAFWSGNEAYWKTKWNPSIDASNTAYRTLVTYKETSHQGRINPSGVWTGTWADPNAPVGVQPQNALTGTIFTVNGDFDSIKIPYEFAKLRFWRNTSVAKIKPGQTASLVPYSLGTEWDEDLDNGFRPAGLIDLSSTAVLTNVRLLDFSNNTFGGGTATHSLTLYRAPSGALVFGAGSEFWGWLLDSHHDPYLNGGNAYTTSTDPNVRQAMVNLFADMGVQPATLRSGLIAASRSTDTVAPTTSLSELDVKVSGSTSTVSMIGLAADTGGRVAGVEVSIDGGAHWHPATGKASWNYSWSTTGVGTDVLARAVDDSVNIGAPASVPTNVVARAIVDSGNSGAIARALARLDSLNSQPWSVVWDNYDAAGRLDQQTITYDDGTRTVARLDSLNSQPWSVVLDNYDAAGRWYQQTITYDDGPRTVARLDSLNSQPWSWVLDNYDAAGRWYQQTITYDDGPRTVARLDSLNSQPWSWVLDNYDAAGRLDQQTITYDDGTRTVARLDSLNSQPWSWVLDNYDAAGRWYQQTITYDDGPRTVARLDSLNSQPWSWVLDNYDAAGRWDTQSIQYDDGSRAWSDIDQLNIAAWYSDNYMYDGSNSLTSHYQVMDDGTIKYLTPPQSA